jgi:hypothetical protein
MTEMLDVGLFTVMPGDKAFDSGKVITMVRRPIHAGTQTLTFTVDRAPKYGGGGSLQLPDRPQLGRQRAEGGRLDRPLSDAVYFSASRRAVALSRCCCTTAAVAAAAALSVALSPSWA